MGLFNWLFQRDQRQEERETADRYASPLAHDWRDLGPIERPAGHSAGVQDDLGNHRSRLSAPRRRGPGHDPVWGGLGADHQGPIINPATGLPMLDAMFDVHLNHFGMANAIDGMSHGMDCDSHGVDFDSQTPGVNPASGLPMVDDMVDINNNMYGVSDDIGGMSGGMDNAMDMGGGMDSTGGMGGFDERW